MGGTWSTKSAVEPHSDEAPAGVEAEGSLTARGPDRDKSVMEAAKICEFVLVDIFTTLDLKTFRMTM